MSVTSKSEPRVSQKLLIRRMTFSQIHKYDITEKILEYLADVQSRAILFSIIKEGKTAEEIAYEARIPLSSVYKKLRNLENMAFVQIEKRDITDKGRKFKVYRSRISGAKINLQSLKPKISLLPNDILTI